MSNRLEKVDFSAGIKADTINKNFDIIQKQVDDERMNTAGYGISEGLNFSVKDGNINSTWLDFNINISSGIIIDKQGQSVYISGKTIPIEPLNLEYCTENIAVDNDGYVTLKNKDKIIYSKSKMCSANVVDVAESNVSIKYGNDVVGIREIGKNYIKILNFAQYVGKILTVSYYSAVSRFDNIYLNNDNEICILTGTDSSVPSIKNGYDKKQDIAILYINGFERYTKVIDQSTGDSIVYYKPSISIYKDLRVKRPIYIKDNNIYFYGTLYRNEQNINFIKPVNPIINTLWYDFATNKLKIYRNDDGIFHWIDINSDTVIPMCETKIWNEKDPIWDDPRCKNTTFWFDQELDRNMLYIPGKNSLQIFVNNIPLHSNQFEEIISTNENELSLEHGENIGIGFRIKETLIKKAVVEARVTHMVTVNTLMTRFQRTATFASRGYFDSSTISENRICTTSDYRYDENQITVYKNGLRLVEGIDFYEDIKTSTLQKGNVVNRFQLSDSITLEQDDIVEYEILTTIYSYDHIDKYFNDMNEKFTILKNDVDNKTKSVQEEVTEYKESNNQAMQTLKDQGDANTEALEDTYKKSEKIKESNLDPSIISKLCSGSVYSSFTATGDTIINPESIVPSINKLKSTDFALFYNVTKNTILRPSVDYSIEANGEKYLIKILNTSAIQQNDVVFITGLILS